MGEAQTGPLIEHFEREVLTPAAEGHDRPARQSRSSPSPISRRDCSLTRPARRAGHRIPLLNQVMVLADPATARKRTVDHALQYLSSASGELLDVARQDLAAMDAWRDLVQSSRQDFDARYRNEFLNGEGFRRFDEAREPVARPARTARRRPRLRDGAVGPPASVPGHSDAVEKALVRPPAVNVGETQVLEGAFRAWLDQLRAEAIRRARLAPALEARRVPDSIPA